MLSNPRADRVRAVRALSRRASRSRAGLFLAEGPQSVREAVRHTPRAVVDLYATGAGLARHTEIAGEAHENGVRVTEVTEDVLAAMVETEAPQGVLAVCRPVDLPLAAALEQGSGAHSRRRGAGPLLVVVLAHVRDPGNAGTVIRCADAAGAARRDRSAARGRDPAAAAEAQEELHLGRRGASQVSVQSLGECALPWSCGRWAREGVNGEASLGR